MKNVNNIVVKELLLLKSNSQTRKPSPKTKPKTFHHAHVGLDFVVILKKFQINNEVWEF